MNLKFFAFALLFGASLSARDASALTYTCNYHTLVRLVNVTKIVTNDYPPDQFTIDPVNSVVHAEYGRNLRLLGYDVVRPTENIKESAVSYTFMLELGAVLRIVHEKNIIRMTSLGHNGETLLQADCTSDYSWAFAYGVFRKVNGYK